MHHPMVDALRWRRGLLTKVRRWCNVAHIRAEKTIERLDEIERQLKEITPAKAPLREVK